MVQDALAEFGQHVLQHRRARSDQEHPVVTEVAPHQRLRAQRKGVGRGVRFGEFRHVQQCYRFRTLYQRVRDQRHSSAEIDVLQVSSRTFPANRQFRRNHISGSA